MLKPSSLTNVRINVGNEQAKSVEKNTEDAVFTMSQIVANLSKEDVTTETVKAAAQTTSDTYYNKFNNKNIYERSIAPEGTPEDQILKDESFYLKVAKGIPADLPYVQIGDVKKSNTDTLKVSVGNNGFVTAPMWKVDDDKNLQIGTVLICTFADPTTGNTDVTAGGVTYSIPAIEKVDNPKPLKITKVAVNTHEGSKSTATFSGDTVTAALDRFDQSIGIQISAGEDPIVDTSLTLYRYDENNQTFGMTPPGTCAGETYTYTRYMFPWAARKVDSAEAGQTREAQIQLVIPGYGVAKFKIVATTIYTE